MTTNSAFYLVLLERGWLSLMDLFFVQGSRANKKLLSEFYYSTLLLCFAPRENSLARLCSIFVEFLRIYRDIFTQLSPIIS